MKKIFLQFGIATPKSMGGDRNNKNTSGDTDFNCSPMGAMPPPNADGR